MKSLVICADGTWNRPEKDLKKDVATNVLRLARAVAPATSAQQVFYDWGVGSYYDQTIGGATGRGLHKNILDDYRYLVQNYNPGDRIYLFGFSRGAYTVRSLCGLINNCGILRRDQAHRIEEAFRRYKSSSRDWHPEGKKSVEFRAQYSHPSRTIDFVGVWDTVGAMGIPISFLGLFDDKDEFYDTKLGRNVAVARHAMAIDEHRRDFEPTIWQERPGLDIKQVWFAGAHSDIGGNYQRDRDGGLISDAALEWMLDEAAQHGLSIEPHVRDSLCYHAGSSIHNSYRKFYRVKKRLYRPINHGHGPVLIHRSVQQRWQQDAGYRPKNLEAYLDEHGWPAHLED